MLVRSGRLEVPPALARGTGRQSWLEYWSGLGRVGEREGGREGGRMEGGRMEEGRELLLIKEEAKTSEGGRSEGGRMGGSYC